MAWNGRSCERHSVFSPFLSFPSFSSSSSSSSSSKEMQAPTSRHDLPTMKALQVTAYGLVPENLQVNTIPKLEVKPGCLLIRVKIACLNPVDHMQVVGHFKWHALPHTLGCDMAGIVEAVGPGVTGHRVGDEVCGFTGFWRESGTLAEYCVIRQELVLRKPKDMSFEEAATIGQSSLTAAIGIFKPLNIPLPSKSTIASQPEPSYLLVWGASGSVGAFAVQLASLAGFVVIGVCSPHNFELVRQLGATHMVDRDAPDAVEKIRRYSEGKLRVAYDNVTNKETTEKCCAALATDGSKVLYSAVLPKTVPVPDHVTYHEIFLPTDLVEGLPYLGEVTKEVDAFLASGMTRLGYRRGLSSPYSIFSRRCDQAECCRENL